MIKKLLAGVVLSVGWLGIDGNLHADPMRRNVVH